VGSNPTQGIDVCVRLFYVCAVLCEVAALRRADHSSKESYRLRKNDYGTEVEAQGPTKGCRAIDEWSEWMFYSLYSKQATEVYEMFKASRAS
jgi:hypothetical protein